MKRAGYAIATALIMCLGANTAWAECDWQMIGERPVDRRADHDTINVNESEGSFESLQLRVQNAPVEFDKVVVHYRNGTKQELEMRDEIPAGGTTRTIDLEGDANERNVTQVTFDYETTADEGRRAVVQLWGRT